MLGRERLLADRCVHDPALVHAKLDLARLQFLDRLGNVHRHRAGLGVGHQTARAQHLAQRTELAHHVGRRHDHVGVDPAVLDLLDVLHAHEIGAGRLGLLDFLALRDHQHAHLLAGAVRQRDGAADDLVGVLGIDTQAHRDVHRLVEFRERRRLHAVDRFAVAVELLRLDRGDRGAVLLAVNAH